MQPLRRALFSILALAAVQSPLHAQETLKTAVDGTFAPHAMPKISGGLEGFNIDVVDEMSKRFIHRPILIVDAAQFAGLIPALQAGTYDFLFAAVVTVTPGNAPSRMLFTMGYRSTPTTSNFLTLASDWPDVTSLDQLKGKVIAVQNPSPSTSAGRRRPDADKYGWSTSNPTRTQHRRGAGRARRPRLCRSLGRHRHRLDRQEQPAPEKFLHRPSDRARLVDAHSATTMSRCAIRLDDALKCIKLDGTMAKLHLKSGSACRPSRVRSRSPPSPGLRGSGSCLDTIRPRTQPKSG